MINLYSPSQMKCHHLLAVAVVFVAGSFGIIEAYSPFGGYNRAPFDNVWVRADSRARAGSAGEDEATEQRMTGAKRPSGAPVFHSALSYGKRAEEDDNAVERRGYHSGLPFGKRTAIERRAYQTGLPFGKRDEEDAEQDAMMERRGFNSALMFGKRLHTGLPFGKRAYQSALPFGKRLETADEGDTMERRGYHSGLPFGKRATNDEAVSNMLDQLRSEEN